MSDLSANIQNGVAVASSLATVAAPIVAIYNPAAGAALSILAPVVSNFILSESQILITLNTEMTKEEMIKALQESKSINWGITPLEVPTPVV